MTIVETAIGDVRKWFGWYRLTAWGYVRRPGRPPIDRGYQEAPLPRHS